MTRPRVLYLAGPGDATAVLRDYSSGKRHSGVAHVAYSEQVYRVCDSLGVELLTISTAPREDDFVQGSLRAKNIPDPLRNAKGWRYHYATYKYARRVIEEAEAFHANVLVCSTEPYPFLFQSLVERGVKVIPALHAAVLPQYKKASFARRWMAAKTGEFFGESAFAILSHPGICADQAYLLASSQPRPIVEFIPLFPQEIFSQNPSLLDSPDPGQFRVITVGRVEPEKGIFDLIDIADELHRVEDVNVRFDVCGEGSALESARETVRRLGLDEVFTLHGWVSMEKLEELWRESHAAVVPTTKDFVEGFNQVAVEAILAGKPVITSEVCPAIEYVRESAIQVEPENKEEYKRAIVRLARDRELYENLADRCDAVAAQFFDEAKSFGAGFRYLLECVDSELVPEERRHPPVQSPQ